MPARTLTFGSVILFAVAALCPAQEAANPQESERDHPMMQKRHRDRQEGMLQMLVRELKLDEAQEAQLKTILDEHRNRERELRISTPIPPELQEKTAKVRQAMMRAREAGDMDTLQQLREELQGLHAEREEFLKPVKEKLDESQELLHDQILNSLRDDQKARFVELWDEQLTGGDPYGGPIRNPRALKSQVEKLPDLSPEQKKQVNALFEQFRRASRDVQNSGLKARKELTKKLYDDVFALLDPGQKEKVEKALGGERGQPKMGRQRPPAAERGGPGARPPAEEALPPPAPAQ